jgi:hypothetical protein
MNRDQNVPKSRTVNKEQTNGHDNFVNPKTIVSKPVAQNIVSFCCSVTNHLSYALAEESLNPNDLKEYTY